MSRLLLIALILLHATSPSARVLVIGIEVGSGAECDFPELVALSSNDVAPAIAPDNARLAVDKLPFAGRSRGVAFSGRRISVERHNKCWRSRRCSFADIPVPNKRTLRRYRLIRFGRAVLDTIQVVLCANKKCVAIYGRCRTEVLVGKWICGDDIQFSSRTDNSCCCVFVEQIDAILCVNR